MNETKRHGLTRICAQVDGHLGPCADVLQTACAGVSIIEHDEACAVVDLQPGVVPVTRGLVLLPIREADLRVRRRQLEGRRGEIARVVGNAIVAVEHSGPDIGTRVCGARTRGGCTVLPERCISAIGRTQESTIGGVEILCDRRGGQRKEVAIGVVSDAIAVTVDGRHAGSCTGRVKGLAHFCRARVDVHVRVVAVGAIA